MGNPHKDRWLDRPRGDQEEDNASELATPTTWMPGSSCRTRTRAKTSSTWTSTASAVRSGFHPAERGQVLAEDDDDDMECADYEEQIQHPKSDEDEGCAEYEFPELDMGIDLRKSEREPEIPVGGEVDPRQGREPRVRVRGLARPASLTKTQRRQHDLEGHTNYHPGCPFLTRCIGLADRHEQNRDEEDQRAGDEDEHQEVSTRSFDFCFLMEKDQGKSIPTLVARDGKSC